jgi:hypothetical protein
VPTLADGTPSSYMVLQITQLWGLLL